ncbi:hypothetical protein H4S02_001185 [Coemansia sp. RSA 2611]|nr:hypothetical protein H4S02_001185 [Coemansia sp. RSA 2611]
MLYTGSSSNTHSLNVAFKTKHCAQRIIKTLVHQPASKRASTYKAEEVLCSRWSEETMVDTLDQVNVEIIDEAESINTFVDESVSNSHGDSCLFNAGCGKLDLGTTISHGDAGQQAEVDFICMDFPADLGTFDASWVHSIPYSENYVLPHESAISHMLRTSRRIREHAELQVAMHIGIKMLKRRGMQPADGI